MVVQKTINNLKERPKDEKTAVATGAAVFVVAVLLFFWGLWFVQKAKRGGEFDTYIGTKQDVFLTPAVREAEKVLQDTMRPNDDLLRDLRESSIETSPDQNPDIPSESNIFSVPESESNF